MKKTFRSILAGALTLLAVSCYDDSALRSAISALESRVTELENKLNTDVSTLNSKIDGLDAAYKLADQNLAASIQSLTSSLDALDGVVDGLISDKTNLLAAIEDLKKADKNLADKDTEILAALVGVGVTNVSKTEAGVVITFVDGAAITVPAKPENGIVTVVEEEGVKYWAVVVNGQAQSLDVKVGHPSLEFEVDPETNELLYSVDGGEFEGTGAFVADDQDYLLTDFYQGETDEIDWDTYEYIKEDFYTLVFGGVEYQLPLYKVDNSVVTIKAGKTYFAYGESKTIDVVVADITSMYLMTKPDGWKAKLDGKKLTVTAPAEEKVAAELADADGEVLLHCSTTDGKCKIARLAVATSQGFSLTVDEDGKITITNPNTMTSTHPMTGMTTFGFQDAYLGLAPVTVFEKDPKAFVQNAPYDYDNVAFMINVWKQNTMDWDTEEYKYGGPYVEGVYEIDVIEATVAEVYEYYTYDEIPDGSRFVVWACPVNEMGEPQVDDLVFGYYSTPVIGNVVSTKKSFTDVELEITVSGAETYYVGMATEEMTYGFDIHTYLPHREGPFGSFQQAVQAGMPQYAFMNMGTLMENDGEALTINASDLYGGTFLPKTKFYVWVFPIVNGLALEDYTYEENLKPYVYEFTTDDIAAGGSLTATLGDADCSYTSIKANVSAENAVLVYYNYYDVEEYNELGEGVAADLLANGFVSPESEFVAVKNDLDPGTSLYLAALVVGEDGLYGSVVEKLYSTPALVYSETFIAQVGEPVVAANGSNWTVTMPVTVEGGTAAKYYYYWNSTARTAEQLNTLPLKDYYYYYEAKAIPALTYYQYYDSYQFAVVVESANGELSKPVIVTVNKPSAE